MASDRYLDYQKQLARRTRKAQEAAAAELRERIPELVAELTRRGATRITIFGSLARGAVDEHSDVDVAAEGLPATRYFETMAALYRIMGRPVDLIRMEEAPPRLRERIIHEGMVVHGGS